MNTFRIFVVTATIFFGSALSITADAPPPTCCSANQQFSGPSPVWLILRIVLGL